MMWILLAKKYKQSDHQVKHTAPQPRFSGCGGPSFRPEHDEKNDYKTSRDMMPFHLDGGSGAGRNKPGRRPDQKVREMLPLPLTDFLRDVILALFILRVLAPAYGREGAVCWVDLAVGS